LTKKWSPPEIQECDLWQGNICGVRCMSLWSKSNGHTTPIFVENSHERPFSIIPKANTYGFLTKKWSPPKTQECDLWQGNICGVRCMLGAKIVESPQKYLFFSIIKCISLCKEGRPKLTLGRKNTGKKLRLHTKGNENRSSEFRLKQKPRGKARSRRNEKKKRTAMTLLCL
jgi:hypothetical protein